MITSFIATVVVCAFVHDAFAQSTFPARAVRIISGFAPGGATDVAARAVSQRMTESLGQPVVVENRPGAAGIIAAELAARSTPDGHMLYLANATLGAPTLFTKLPFDITKDFAFVSLIGMGASALVLHPSVPAKTVKELITLARGRPGQLNYASAGHHPAFLVPASRKSATPLRTPNIPVGTMPGFEFSSATVAPNN